LSFVPAALLAQNINKGPVTLGAPVKYHAFPKEGYQSPVQVNQQPQAGMPIDHGGGNSRPSSDVGYKPAVSDTIGLTTYDLQTNGALAKRVQLYSSGKLSAVWIYSPEPPDANFTSRYSGYNTYNGSSWDFPYKTTFHQYEFDRSGWPNIGEVTANGNTYEMLTSHYAAAASTTYAGGIYWYKNSGVGNTDFTKTIDLSNNRAITNGLLWPRMATSGDKIYMIGTYEDTRVISGVINPVVYYRYNITTGQFTAKGITLPGYDNTRYASNGADEYSIDARDSFVAILIGGSIGNPNDLSLWKSSDSGKTFKKTIIDSFVHAPWSYRTNTAFSDTARTNDGTGSVTIDNKGVAHVSWSPVFITNPSPTPGDTQGPQYFFPDNSGIAYWNDKDKNIVKVGQMIDYDNVGDAALYGQGSNLAQYNAPATIAGYGHNFCCFSNIATDASGNIFVVFSAPHVDDQYYLGWAYRHVYCSVYNASSETWLPQQDIVQTWQVENVFATVAPVADSKIHFTFMQDDVPGIYVAGGTNANQSITTDTMVYQEISTADLLAGKIGLVDYLGVNEKITNNLFNTGAIYPNPAADILNLSLNLTRPATVTIRMYNVLGEELLSQNYDMLPSGLNKLQFSVSNLPAGVYMCNVSAGGYTTTQRVVVEK